MKVIHSNGSELTVRDIGPVRMTLKISGRGGRPLPIIDHEDMEEDAARALLKELLATGSFDRFEPDAQPAPLEGKQGVAKPTDIKKKTIPKDAGRRAASKRIS